jgi:hypothetical protein
VTQVAWSSNTLYETRVTPTRNPSTAQVLSAPPEAYAAAVCRANPLFLRDDGASPPSVVRVVAPSAIRRTPHATPKAAAAAAAAAPQTVMAARRPGVTPWRVSWSELQGASSPDCMTFATPAAAAATAVSGDGGLAERIAGTLQRTATLHRQLTARRSRSASPCTPPSPPAAAAAAHAAAAVLVSPAPLVLAANVAATPTAGGRTPVRAAGCSASRDFMWLSEYAFVRPALPDHSFCSVLHSTAHESCVYPTLNIMHGKQT